MALLWSPNGFAANGMSRFGGVWRTVPALHTFSRE